MNTQFKFVTSENSNKYVISMNREFYKNKTRHFVFRTEDQTEDFFRAAIKKGIVKKLKDNGVSLILFTYKNREFALAVNIFSNPEKKTTTIINLKHILLQNNKRFTELYNACSDENIATMTDYILPTRIVVRDYLDIYCDTFYIKKQRIDTYIAYYIQTNKKFFLEEYDITNIFHKISGAIINENNNAINFTNVLDKEPFWVWLEEKTLEDENNYYTVEDKDSFLCCLSLTKKRKNKTVIYEFLLDQIYKNPNKQRLQTIKKYKELIFEEPILIQKIVRKSNRKGLKIIKKGNAHV